MDDTDNPRAVADLARLRVLLRTVLECYASGRPITPALRSDLEREMNRAPMELQIEGARAGLRLQHRRSGHPWDVVVAEIATSAARLMVDRRTVKVCANPNCSWMFVDESRPHTRRWCNTGVCGSLINVRRYRLAHAADRTHGERQKTGT